MSIRIPHSLYFTFNPETITFQELNELVRSVTNVAYFMFKVVEEHLTDKHHEIRYSLASMDHEAQDELDSDILALREVPESQDVQDLSITLTCCLTQLLGMQITLPSNLDRYPAILNQLELLMLFLIAGLDVRSQHGIAIHAYIIENKGDRLVPETYEAMKSTLLDIFSL